jgi:hypothetical protein
LRKGGYGMGTAPTVMSHSLGQMRGQIGLHSAVIMVMTDESWRIFLVVSNGRRDRVCSALHFLVRVNERVSLKGRSRSPF